MTNIVAGADAPIWCVHAGKTGDADDLFLKKDCVAIGWSKCWLKDEVALNAM